MVDGLHSTGAVGQLQVLVGGTGVMVTCCVHFDKWLAQSVTANACEQSEREQRAANRVGDRQAIVGVDRGQRDAVVGVDHAAVGVGGARSGGLKLAGMCQRPKTWGKSKRDHLLRKIAKTRSIGKQNQLQHTEQS